MSSMSRMPRRTATCPTRVDLAGGTLDIWPLNMLVNGALTVNVAIDLWATAEIEEIPDAGLRAEIRSEDQGVDEVWRPPASPPANTRLPLIAECVRYFSPERSFRLTTRCASPAGAGLGGSSSLAVGLLGAVGEFLGRPLHGPEELVAVAKDLEARVLGIPTGTQDHLAAAYGGAAAIHYGPGPSVRESLPVDLGLLGSRLVIAYAGASRLSAGSNWDMMRRTIEGEGKTREGLQAIATIAGEMRSALIESDLDAVGLLLDREWQERRRLSPKVSTEIIERSIDVARRAGAIAGKACGAGGGGCIAFLCREGARDAVTGALATLQADGLRLLETRPTATGLTVRADER